MSSLIFHAQFTASKLGKTGLAPTIDVKSVKRSDGSLSAVVTAGSMVESWRGLYYYRLVNADLQTYDYEAVAITTDATVDQKELAALWTRFSEAVTTDSGGFVTLAPGSITVPTGGSGTLYCTPAQLLQRYDANRIGELVRDDGTRANSTELLTDSTLQAILLDATAVIQSALAAGQRYTDAELQTLILDGTHSSSIVRLCADITWALLNARRGWSTEELKVQCPLFATALELLDSLREGTRIFEITGRDAPDKPVNVVLDDPTLGKVFLTSAASRLFGSVSDGTRPQ